MLKTGLSYFKKAPRWTRISTYLVIAYALYAMALGLLTPWILDRQLAPQLSQLLNRPVTIKSITINPFLLRVRVDEFAIKAKSKGPLIAWQRLEGEFEFWNSVFHLTPTFSHIKLVAPHIQLTRSASGALTINDLLQRLAPSETSSVAKSRKNENSSQKKGSASPIPALKIGRIQVLDGQLTFNDKPSAQTLHYYPISLTLSHFDTQHVLSLGQGNTLQLSPNAGLSSASSTSQKSAKAPANRSAQTAPIEGANTLKLMITQESGQLGAKAHFQLAPFKISGQVDLQDWPLARYWSLIDRYFPAQLATGKLALNGEFKVEQRLPQLHWQFHEGQFTLSQLRINDPQGEKQITLAKLAAKHITVTDDQRVSIKQIQLQKPWVQTLLNQKGVSVVNLFTPKSSFHSAAPASGQPTSQPWQVKLHQFVLSDGHVVLHDQQFVANKRWDIDHIHLQSQAISSDLSQPIDYKLAWEVSGNPKQPSQGRFKTTGQLQIKPLKLTNQIDLSGLQLPQFAPYLKPYLNIKLSKGQLGTQGKLTLTPKEKLTYQGNVAISHLDIRDQLSPHPLLKWQKMAIEHLQYSQRQNRLQIDTIALEQPFARVEITPHQQTNLSHLWVKKSSSPATQRADHDSSADASQADSASESTQSTPPLSVAIDTIKINQGRAFFADRSITPHFASSIEQLNGEITNLSSQKGTVAQVNLAGSIDRYAPVSLKGAINPLLARPYLDLDLNFKDVELVSVSPYSGTYAGYYIDKGQISLGLNYQLKQGQLVGKNHIVIQQLQLGKASHSEQAVHLPVKLAIALLQDRHGVIDLGVQVSGDVNNPSFGLGNIIWKAVKNIVTKAVMSPFSLLANLVGADEKLDHVIFAPGHAQLDRSEQQRLRKLAQALKKRPQLKVSIRGGVNMGRDRTAMAEFKLHQQLKSQAQVAHLPDQLSASRFPRTGKLADALRALYVQQFTASQLRELQKQVNQQLQSAAEGQSVPAAKQQTALHIGMYNQLLKAQKVDRGMLEQLAQFRAQQVKSYLVNSQKISAKRIFLLNSRSKLQTEKAQAQLTITH